MLGNQMESDKMIEISEADFPELPEIAALEREIFPDAWSLKSLEETWKQKNAAIFVAKTKEGMAGYLIFYYVLEEVKLQGLQRHILCADKGQPVRCSGNCLTSVGSRR